jgi:predicted PurR-regulated permease PerM
MAAGAVTIAPQIAGEMQGVWRQVSRIASDIRAVIEQHPWVMEALGQAEEADADQGEEQGAEDAQEEAVRAVPDVSAQIASLVTALIGGIATAIVMVAIGLFLTVDPGLYVRGAIKLVPIARRARAAEVLATIGYALRWWLIGQLVSMTVLGVVTSAGLMFFGVELWLGLGLLTALLTFVPFLGPIIAGVPVLLIAFAEGAQTGIAVLIFYLVLQNVEGFLLTPLVQQRAVRLPPALLIAMQVLMGALFGIAGLLVAAPLTAAGMIAVNLLYIEGVLGDTRATPKRRIRPRYEGLP